MRNADNKPDKWRAVIDAHPLESHDPEDWLLYGVALLQTMEPGPDVGKRLQQAALAFLQAQKEGATADQVAQAQRQSILLSLHQATEIARIFNTSKSPSGYKNSRYIQHTEYKSDGREVRLLHMHGFKCAGSTLIWSLERATDGNLIYLESDEPNLRLPWQRAKKHLSSLKQKPIAITSHLMTLPPQDQLAIIKVALIRQPLARIISAYQFEMDTKGKQKGLTFDAYLHRYLRSNLSNYQTRHLSPQQEEDWNDRNGWGARLELIDLDRPDLFVGIVERYDESMVTLEYILDQKNIPIDLSYPHPKNTYHSRSKRRRHERHAEIGNLSNQLVLDATELDESLYKRAEERLNQYIDSIPDFKRKLRAFQERCMRLKRNPPPIKIKPPKTWIRLAPTLN